MMTSHRKIVFPAACLLLGLFITFQAAAESTLRFGREIALDGILVEWPEREKRFWDSAWFWDAVVTEEGVAGYFQSSSAICSTWTFVIEAPLDSYVVPLRGEKEGTFFHISRAASGGVCAVTVEWIIPWESFPPDGEGIVRITAEDGSGSLDPQEVMARRPRSADTGVWVKGTVIGILLVLFVVLQMRIRRKFRRMGSPRRSA